MKRQTKTSKERLTQIIILLISGLILGILVITQAKQFTDYVSSVGRDSTENVFRKIQILKTSNDELEEEIEALEVQLADLSNQADALKSIENEITKNKMIAGEVDIFGRGIIIEINNDIKDIWFTDLVNELLASGAEAISVNNIRLTDSSIGFDTLPNGQIMVNGVIISAPYTFAAIGLPDDLKQALESPLGIIDKMKASIENLEISIKDSPRIDMSKV